MRWLWRHFAFPLISPFLLLPLMVPTFFFRPLQLIVILVVTGLLQLDEILAVTGAFGFMAFYTWGLWTGDDTSNPTSAEFRLGQATLTGGQIYGFVVAMLLLPDFQPVLRWFAAVGIGYYIGMALSAFVTASMETKIISASDLPDVR